MLVSQNSGQTTRFTLPKIWLPRLKFPRLRLPRFLLPDTQRPRQSLAALPIALLLTMPLAMALGLATGMAGRVLQLLGFYEVLAAITLSVTTVALAHVLRWRPRAGALVLALVATLTWLTAHRLTDAWAFRQEQAKLVVEEAHTLAEDFLISGANTPLELVDLGLQAETGAQGVRGALIVEWNSGLLVLRAVGLERRLPPEPLLQALVLAATVAFLTLLIRRALLHLASQPACTTCQRYLRRTQLGHLNVERATALQEAWQQGQRTEPTVETAGPLTAFRETCPAGHTQQPGFALIQVRGRTLGAAEAGLVARLPARP